MKIAITNENGEIFQHFGRCPSFAVYEIIDNKIANLEIISSDDKGHSALVDLLSQLNIELLICGGIGGGAQSALTSHGIHFISGITGNTDIALQAYLNGSLKGDPELGSCDHHHDENHNCSEHGDGHNCSNHSCR